MRLIRQKQQNFQVRIRQKVYKSKTNYPFLSGDSFAKACDISVDTFSLKSRTSLAAAQSIFCPSEQLEQFLQENAHEISAKVLVLGNTDRDFYEIPCKFPPSVESVYLQNSHISNDFFHTLPIGLENLRHGRNGLLTFFKDSAQIINKKEVILVGPYSPTHAERKELAYWSNLSNPFLNVITESISPKKLATIAGSHKFVACPRGNGTDTHRFWETLYRGSIPVVKRSRWSESISNLGLPVLQLSNWDFEEFLNASKQTNWLEFNPRNFSQLWMNYWEKAFSSRVN